MTQSRVNWVELGSLIELSDERNSKGMYSAQDVRGISIEKKIIPTQAVLDGVSLTPYKVFKPLDFSFVTVTSRNGEKITIAMNDTNDTYIVSSLYVVFRIRKDAPILPVFLFMWFCRTEFDRYCRYNSWGSAREYFWYEDICRTPIPLLPISEQQKVVDTYMALRRMKSENEALAAPLIQLCQSKIQGLKKEYELKALDAYIEEVTRTNVDLELGFEDVRGVSNEKVIREYKGSLTGRDLSKFLLIRPNEFVFNKRTNAGMGMCLVKDKPYLFTEDYEAFRIVDEALLLPDYLYLFFIAKDFDRYVLFNSWGSSVIFFHIADMKQVRIPIPDIQIQKAIVDIFNCAQEATRIAVEADKLSRDICPALMQNVINS